MAPPAKRKIKLTDSSVKRLEEGRTWDTEIGGFGVKVYSSGKRQFILRYRSPDKKQREFRVGQFGIINTDEARTKAKILIGKINEGFDPQWERKVGLAAAKDFNALIDKYLEYAATHHKPTSLREVRTYCRLHLRPMFGETKCGDLTRGMVQRCYDRLEHASHFKAKIIQWARIVWSWSEKRELIGEQRNPFAIEINVPKPRRKRILLPDEYKRLWFAIESHRYKGTIPNVALWAIETLILTPLRKRECFRLRWENVDKDLGILFVTEHKTDHYDEPLELPITEALSELLDRVPKSSDWMFPMPDSKSGHLESIDRSWARLRKDADLFEGKKHITLHDLRRSWNSVGASLGYDPATMGKVLGNSARVNVDHYWHLQSQMKRDVSEDVASTIQSFNKLHDT